jgi:hypothetical protein
LELFDPPGCYAKEEDQSTKPTQKKGLPGPFPLDSEKKRDERNPS